MKVNFETSWDDGNILDLRVAKLLRKYKIPATFFVTLDYIGKPGYMDWDDIKGLDRDGLFDVGCHSLSHPSDLKMLHDEFLFAEVNSAKGLLESALDHHVTKFCYPRGRYDQRVMDAVMEAGYVEARTTKVGYLKVEDSLQKHTTVHVYDGRKEYQGNTWYSYALTMLG